jgi:hypothetical protein
VDPSPCKVLGEHEEAHLFPVSAPVDHFKETSSASLFVSQGPREGHRLLAITGSGPRDARWLRDQFSLPLTNAAAAVRGRLRGALQARGKVRCLADDATLLSLSRANQISNDHQSRCNADTRL